MEQKNSSTADGLRGYFEDASGHRWTVGVDLLISALVTLWLAQMFFESWELMPLTAGEAALRNLGLELPAFLQSFISWVGHSGGVFVVLLFAATVLLALRSSYQSYGDLYTSLSWMSLMVLFEATGAPAVTSFWLVCTIAGIGLAAYVNSIRVEKFSDRREADVSDTYFGERPPLLVAVHTLLGLCAPLVFVGTLIGVVTRAFSFGGEEPFRLSRGFRKHYEKLRAEDPEAADRLRVEVLLRAAEANRLPLEMKMIVDGLLSEPHPRGAAIVEPPTRMPLPPRAHSMELAMRRSTQHQIQDESRDMSVD